MASRLTQPKVPHYEVLGIAMNAPDDRIKAAWQKSALAYHPDRLVHAPASEQAEGQEKMKAINTAYEVLRDPITRARYNMALILTQQNKSPAAPQSTRSRPAQRGTQQASEQTKPSPSARRGKKPTPSRRHAQNTWFSRVWLQQERTESNESTESTSPPPQASSAPQPDPAPPRTSSGTPRGTKRKIKVDDEGDDGEEKDLRPAPVTIKRTLLKKGLRPAYSPRRRTNTERDWEELMDDCE